MKQPNFFILGAPKCGTSAMHQYLQDRRDVFMCDPKEPAYFCEDFKGLRRRRSVPLETFDDYLKLYRSASDEHLVVGEGSTLYLASNNAISKITSRFPSAKFLVMLRNPVDFVVSFHRQKTFDLLEDVQDFETAWNLQSERKSGNKIPPHCHEPAVLQYRKIGSFGSQLLRAHQSVDPKHLKIVTLDDFQDKPVDVFEDVLQFLGLESEGRTDFPRVNDARQVRFQWLQVLYSQDWPLVGPLVRGARRVGSKVSVARSAWQRLRAKPGSKKPIRPEFRQELFKEFESEVDILEDLLKQDLSHWRA